MKDKTDYQNAKIKLTPMQLKVLQCWAEEGSDQKHISEQLGISAHTVHTHLRRMRHKLGVKRTFDVYRYAQQEGLLKE